MDGGGRVAVAARGVSLLNRWLPSPTRMNTPHQVAFYNLLAKLGKEGIKLVRGEQTSRYQRGSERLDCRYEIIGKLGTFALTRSHPQYLGLNRLCSGLR